MAYNDVLHVKNDDITNTGIGVRLALMHNGSRANL